MSEDLNKERQRLIKELRQLYERIDVIIKRIGELNTKLDAKR